MSAHQCTPGRLRIALVTVADRHVRTDDEAVAEMRRLLDQHPRGRRHDYLPCRTTADATPVPDCNR
jgi:hypothetical protein